MTHKVLVLGGNFAGLTAALTVQAELGAGVEVTVISPAHRFLFTPSLIWVPFGERTLDQISFPLRPTLERRKVECVHEAATSIDPDIKTVTTESGSTFHYDHLVIATGYQNDFDGVPGIGPGGHADTITTADDAFAASYSWHKFTANPGDVVIGATQGAGCFGAAYEFLFNTAYQLKKAGLSKQVKLTYVTAEPFLGHFGIGGLPGGERLLRMFTEHSGIQVRTGAAMEYVDDGRLRLTDGTDLDFRWAMIIPAFRGQDVVAKVTEIVDDRGFVRVRDTYQTHAYDDVYAVGAAAAVEVPWTTPVPVGVPKTGFPTEQQARVAARNIASQVRGEEPRAHKAFGDIPALCVMDAGNNGVLIVADKMLPPRRAGLMLPGPQSHAMKLAFERYFLWKNRRGYASLP